MLHKIMGTGSFKDIIGRTDLKEKDGEDCSIFTETLWIVLDYMDNRIQHVTLE